MQRVNVKSDDGAMAVFIAIVFTAVFIGFSAYAVDVGSMYQERRQLQNAADAGVLAVAADCAAGRVCDQTTATSTAEGYTTPSTNYVTDAARGGVTVTFPAAATVRVDTSTKRASGTILPPFFAQVLGYGGATIGAHATAIWGPPKSMARVFPMTFSLCEFQHYVGDSENYVSPETLPTPPSYTGTWPSQPQEVIYSHSTSFKLASIDCEGTHAASNPDLPGGFGWLDLTSDDCIPVFRAGEWLCAAPGHGSDSIRKGVLEPYVGSIVDIPVFDEKANSGRNGKYHIVGFAAFYLTGYWREGGDQVASLVDGENKCPSGSASDSCIKGYFTHDLVPTSGTVDPTAPDFGVRVVQLID